MAVVQDGMASQHFSLRHIILGVSRPLEQPVGHRNVRCVVRAEEGYNGHDDDQEHGDNSEPNS